jgi:hypothetical protein
MDAKAGGRASGNVVGVEESPARDNSLWNELCGWVLNVGEEGGGGCGDVRML